MTRPGIDSLSSLLNKETFEILLIEDDEEIYKIVSLWLSHSGKGTFNLTWCDNLTDGIDRAENKKYDAVLLDLNVADSSGIITLQKMIKAAPQLPIVVMTGNDEENMGVMAIQSGAQDYLLKSSLSAKLFIRTLKHAVSRKINEQKLEKLAHYDNLTGLANRVLLEIKLAEALDAAKQSNSIASVLYVDIDGFKQINDNFGHHAGDLVLAYLARRLTESVRDGDMVARVGGDEFVIILGEISNGGEAAIICQRIIESIANPFSVEGREVFVSASIGISLYPNYGSTPAQLIKNADIAMYHAKTSGKNTYRYFSEEINDQVFTKVKLKEGLDRAIGTDELALHYQPIIDLKTDRIIGYESLLRWNDPEKGLIMPNDFIPAVEGSKLMLAIGEWVIGAAASQLAAWKNGGVEPFSVAINFSIFELEQDQFVNMIDRILASSGVNPGQIDIEITERTLMRNIDNLQRKLGDLKKMGLNISIDDFGTGFSSISHLKYFPIDKIKIDRSFIMDVEEDERSASIVKGVIALAHALEIKVVGEGVETEDQLEFLKSIECDFAQGYLLGRPAPPDKLQTND